MLAHPAPTGLIGASSAAVPCRMWRYATSSSSRTCCRPASSRPSCRLARAPPVRAQHPQVVRDIRLAHAGYSGQVTDAQLAGLDERHHEPAAARVGQQLEELCDRLGCLRPGQAVGSPSTRSACTRVTSQRSSGSTRAAGCGASYLCRPCCCSVCLMDPPLPEHMSTCTYDMRSDRSRQALRPFGASHPRPRMDRACPEV